LVKLGYVERKRDEQDRRIVHLQFSTKGKIKFLDFKKVHMERIASIFEVLSEPELDLLINIPQKILRNADLMGEKKS
jgi:DNA-binding MarR family transcriptional regulator